MRLTLPGFLQRSGRPGRASRDAKTEMFPVSPRWFYSITTPDGTEHLALSVAPGATIYAHAPEDTVVVPRTPLVIHQAAGAYLWRTREGGGVVEADLEALTCEVSSAAAQLVIAEVRMRGAFRNGWAERLQVSGLRIVSPDGLARATVQLPALLGSRGVGGSMRVAGGGTGAARCDTRGVPAAV